MASVSVEEGSAHAQAIQGAVQQRLLEMNWAPEENDTTLSDYITMMLVNGKDLAGVQAELAGDLLGLGEDDPMVPEFTNWLFTTAHSLAPQQQQDTSMEQNHDQNGQDAQMDDAASAPSGVPIGPKAMRNGSNSRGRGGRNMRDQVNRQMDNGTRIKGAANGAGRIDSHANRNAPRGPRGASIANGMQRMAQGKGAANAMNMMGQQANMGPGGDSQQLMLFQMMEMQAKLMEQMVNSNGGFSPGGRGGFKTRGHKPTIDKRGQNKLDNTKCDGMDVDGVKKVPFDTMCHFNDKCTNPECPYAHQTPASTKSGSPAVDLADTCKFGAHCTNFKCAGRHPSPSLSAGWQQRQMQQWADPSVCKFYPNCTRPDCPFLHTEAAKPTVECRFFPCTKPTCSFAHNKGQKTGGSNVWTPGGAQANGDKTNRFAEFKENENLPEELIKPGQAEAKEAPAAMDTEIPT